MRIELCTFYTLCLVLLSCGNDNKAAEVLDKEVEGKTAVISAKDIEKLDYNDYALSNESEEAVANWEKYQELNIQIGYLKKVDLSFFNGEKELLNKFIIELKTTIPEQLQTNPILSRIVILETALLNFNENLTLQRVDNNTKLSNIKDVLQAFSNFNYQMNKKLEGDFYDRIQPE